MASDQAPVFWPFISAPGLPPTGAQMRAIAEIADDMAGEGRMNRLLQGDVGSGKTLVALRAMLAAVDAGGQAVLLAPTEVLAAQHHRTITGLLGDLGAGRMLGAPDVATEVALLSSAPVVERV